MQMLEIEELTPPPVPADRRIIAHTNDGLFCVSDGKVYRYSVSGDSWSLVYQDNVFGVDVYHDATVGDETIRVYDVKYYYSYYNVGTYSYRNRIVLLADCGLNGIKLIYLDTSNFTVVGPYTVYIRYQDESLGVIHGQLRANAKTNKLYIMQMNQYMDPEPRCIDLDHLVFDSAHNRYELDWQYYYIDKTMEWGRYPLSSYVGCHENMIDDYLYTSGDNYIYGAGSIGDNDYDIVSTICQDSKSIIGITYSAKYMQSMVTRLYINNSSDIQKVVIGYIDAIFNDGDTILQYDNHKIISDVYDYKLFVSTADNHFLKIILGEDEALLRLKHMGQIVKINGYNTGFLPFKHNGHTYWLKECENGDANQSPLVIKHNGTLHYIRK